MTTRTIRTLQTAQAAQPAQILSRPSRRKVLLGAATAAVGLTLAACSGKDSSGEKGGTTVTVVTHDSFVLPDELIEAFNRDSGYTLEQVSSGDAGELVNKLILAKDPPLGDAVFGIDNSFASRALGEGIIDTSLTPSLPQGAEQYIVNDTPALAPIDFGEVCVNIDSVWFDNAGLTPPATFEDLTSPEYKDLFVAIERSVIFEAKSL